MFSMARVFYSSIVDENSLIKTTFRLFCRRAIKTTFSVVNFWKNRFSDKDLFRRQMKKKWNFQKTVFLAWCDEKILHLKWVFTHAQTIASTVELSFDVPTIFLDRDSRENVVFGKLYAFGQGESNVKFFSRLVLGFFIKCWVGRCKTIFFADAQLVQKISFCVVQ